MLLYLTMSTNKKEIRNIMKIIRNIGILNQTMQEIKSIKSNNTRN